MKLGNRRGYAAFFSLTLKHDRKCPNRSIESHHITFTIQGARVDSCVISLMGSDHNYEASHMLIRPGRRDILGGALAAVTAAACAPVSRVSSSAMLENPDDTTKEKIAINDMLERVAKLQPGQNVLIMAHLDGLYGGDNLVEFEVLELIAECVREYDADPQILLIDRKHPTSLQWNMPPTMVAAIESADCLIMHSFDYVTEEVLELRRLGARVGNPLVRNFATTRAMLRSEWVQTPYELVAEIRYLTSQWFRPGDHWEITHDNGTHLVGGPVRNAPLGYDRPDRNYPFYDYYRAEAQTYRPFPEWVIPPIAHDSISGVLYSDAMLSYWTRYIGIEPFYDEPVRIEFEDSRIMDISGGRTADAIMRHHKEVLEPRYGDAVWYTRHIHPGIHPNAALTEQEAPRTIHRRLADHANSRNFHLHLGNVDDTGDARYWPHVTSDLKDATWTSGPRTLLDRGFNTYLEDPRVVAIAQRYPGRPGIPPRPES